MDLILRVDLYFLRSTMQARFWIRPLALALALACVQCEKATGITADVKCQTTKGEVLLKLFPENAPIGVKHLAELIQADFFTNVPLFRTVPGFLMQFGRMVGNNKWDSDTIKDDHPAKKKLMTRGTLSYAGGGKDSRTNQLFFAFCTSCGGLGDQPWETPIGQIVGAPSLAVLDALEHAHSYGDMPPWGKGPDPGRIQGDADGSYLKLFPKLDYIKGCKMTAEWHHGL